jgi:hypothetical protein
MVPVPIAKPTFWNSLVLMDFDGFQRWMIIPSSLVVSAAVWLALRSAPRYLRLFAFGFVGIWIFTVIKYYGFVRHIGAEMILFLACIWLATNNRDAEDVVSWWSRSAVRLILAANVLAWGMASYYHATYDFSGSREMARIIQSSGFGERPIVADADGAASAVAGYLNRPLYYAANRKQQTYIRWNTERTGGGPEDALSFAGELSAGNNRGVLLLLNYPLEQGPARLLARTRDAVVEDEVFYLYEYIR